jgi:Tfp pilus assembly protein FimT
MELLMALVVVAIFALLAAAANSYGVDSRVYPERSGETNAWI